MSKVYLMMSEDDTYDMTLIATIEVLIQKLRNRQTDKKRLYRIEQLNQALMTLESQYEGRIPEEYEVVADAFDERINNAMARLREDVKEKQCTISD